jgi:putative nucleotidyltransferase with HDIG domain
MGLPDRESALALLRQHVKQENLVRHCLATEAIMRALARRFSDDEELWGISGLLHDLDLELVGEDMSIHARKTAEILSSLAFPQAGIEAILAHNGDVLGISCKSRFEFCLTAAESITGLVVACTLVYPSKKVADVQTSSIRKRMKEKRFAANVSRERIMQIEHAGLGLDDFIALALAAMQGIPDQIGL